MEEMKPGAELDRLVAEKVLGLGRDVRLRGSTNIVRIYDPNPYYHDGSDSRKDLRRAGPKPYSTDLAPCVAAAEEARKAGKLLSWELSAGKNRGTGAYAIVEYGEDVHVGNHGETPAHALSLALLAAVEGPK